MWSDNQTDRDLLNFRHVADIAAERIFGAHGQPLSIGISGGWGMGKSSMMELLRIAIQDRIAEQRAISNVSRAHGDEGVHETVRFVHFNPWTYQGFDDTRAALMEIITRALADHAEKNKAGLGPVVVDCIGDDDDVRDLPQERIDQVVRDFLGNEIAHQVALDVGLAVLQKAPNARTGQQRLEEMQDYVRQELGRRYDERRALHGRLDRDSAARLGREVIADAFDIFESYVS